MSEYMSVESGLWMISPYPADLSLFQFGPPVSARSRRSRSEMTPVLGVWKSGFRPVSSGIGLGPKPKE